MDFVLVPLDHSVFNKSACINDFSHVNSSQVSVVVHGPLVWPLTDVKS